MKFSYILIFIIGFSFSANAQKAMSDYSFLVVPEQFDFLTEKDKYSLNSMAKFYFEKYGFNAFLANKVPNVKRCEGLYADVIESRSLLTTKLQIILKDCNNIEIYKSDFGKSKIKEYKLAYQDALRDAFISFGAQNVSQKNMQLYDAADADKNNEAQQEIENPNSVTTNVKTDQTTVNSTTKNSIANASPDAKFSNYKKNSENFLLRKTGEGYSLYQETEKADNGLMLLGKIISINDIFRFIDLNGDSYTATFDKANNLSIDYKGRIELYTAAN